MNADTLAASDEAIRQFASDCERITDDGRRAKDFIHGAMFRARGHYADDDDSGIAAALLDTLDELRQSIEIKALTQHGYDPDGEASILAGCIAYELKRAADMVTVPRVLRMAEHLAASANGNANGWEPDADTVRDWLQFVLYQILPAFMALTGNPQPIPTPSED